MVSKSNVSKWRLNISWLRKICAWMWRKSGLFHVWAGNLAWGGWQLILWFSPFSCIQHGLNKWAIGWGWFALSRQTEAHMEVKTWKLTRVVRGHFWKMDGATKKPKSTPPKTNMQPENYSLEKEKHLQAANFWVPCCFSGGVVLCSSTRCIPLTVLKFSCQDLVSSQTLVMSVPFLWCGPAAGSCTISIVLLVSIPYQS